MSGEVDADEADDSDENGDNDEDDDNNDGDGAFGVNGGRRRRPVAVDKSEYGCSDLTMEGGAIIVRILILIHDGMV